MAPIFRSNMGVTRTYGDIPMLDVMYLAIGFGFLAVAVLYVVACDRL